MVNTFQFKKFNFKMQLINLSLILNCTVVPNTSNWTVRHSSINISLTYLRELEVPELKDGICLCCNKKPSAGEGYNLIYF